MNYFDIRDDSHYLIPILFSFFKLSSMFSSFNVYFMSSNLFQVSTVFHYYTVYTFIAVWAYNFKSVSCPILRVNELNISQRWTGKFKDTTDKLAPKLDYRIN